MARPKFVGPWTFKRIDENSGFWQRRYDTEKVLPNGKTLKVFLRGPSILNGEVVDREVVDTALDCHRLADINGEKILK